MNKYLHTFLISLFSIFYAFGQYVAENAIVDALGTSPTMLASPNIYTNDILPGTVATLSPGDNKDIFYDALDYQGNPTRVYAKIRIPLGASAANPVPGVVLVHGGGGTANQGWVNRWFNEGYAAISIAVEGQTASTTAPVMNTGWSIHNMPGPVRPGVYNDTNVTPITDQWMYHCVADTVLANSLLRDLPFVDASKVGVMGISWGGVITSTTIGIDNRFAFAIPTYGCGNLYDASNAYGANTGGDPVYEQVWDPMVRLQNATMPVLWYSWPQDQFPMDSLANCYHKQGGARMVSLVPRMQHGRGFAIFRPEGYDFADSIVDSTSPYYNGGAPWATQQSVNLVGNTATVVFNSKRDLEFARLVYTSDYDVIDTSYTTNQSWTEVDLSAPVESPTGVFTVTATIPADTKAWYVNAYVDNNDPTGNVIDDQPDPYTQADWLTVRFNQDAVVSSDYQEVIGVTPSPTPKLSITHTLGNGSTNGVAQLTYDYPHNIEVTGLTILGGTHSTAFSVLSPSTFPYIVNADPALGTATSVTVKFDNTVAGLTAGGTATSFLSVQYKNLDGSTDQFTYPLEATIPGGCETVTYNTTSNWSSQVVDCCDDVVINNNAILTLDGITPGAATACVDEIIINDGVAPNTGIFNITQNVALTVGTGINIGAGTGTGALNQTTGTVNTPSLVINSNNAGSPSSYSMSGGTLNLQGMAGIQVNANSVFLLSGGTVNKTISGSAPDTLGDATASGLIQIQGGSLQLTGGVATDGIIQRTPIEISGGDIDIQGQFLLNNSITVTGSNASVDVSFLNTLPGSSITMNLDAIGVSKFNIAGWMSLGNASLTVDGSSYTGGAGTIVLLDSVSLATQFNAANVSLTGFPANLNVQLLQDTFTDDVSLVITEISAYDTWAATYGLTGTSFPNTEDPDNDGFPNLHEFAFGGDPTLRGSTPTPTCFDGGKFTVTRRSSTGLTYILEECSTLQSADWIPSIGTSETVTGTTGDYETVEITNGSSGLWNSSFEYFLRMKVTLTP